MINLARVFGWWAPDLELAEDEYFRGPRIRRQAGELEVEEQSGLLEIHAAYVSRWTRAIPRDEGLWFAREPGGSTRVIETWRVGEDMWGGWSDIPPRRLKDSGLEFSDQPIREPR